MKGATNGLKLETRALAVSIHAPMKGATIGVIFAHEVQLVSIHTPMKGATCLANLLHFAMFGFNPRTHEGCDSKSVFLQPLLFVPMG